MKEKYDALQAHIDELQVASTKEHQDIYKEIDRRIGLEPGTSVKTMADGIGSRIQATEIELGRLEVTVERFDTTSRSQHEAVMRGMMEVTKQISALTATVGLLVERRMERIDRIADHLGG